MLNRRKMLKVKIKSLAAEAAIIRREERLSKPGGPEQCELHNHRVRDVRDEQRHSLLAYAFIRGKPLSLTEPSHKREPDWKRVAKLVEKFGTTEYPKKSQENAFAEWKAGQLTGASQ
jgi:hypothetical protein